ncbi:hypothetical protein [Candidatus Electrothrix sp.]|uniref:hypothetical protein n=1 Tax=Candidatus Electrothrix sp. TaxID=2170559 RepID=UPI00405605CB
MNSSHILPPQKTVLLVAVLPLLFLVSPPAHAHKLNVFAWGSDRQIYGETFFNGGRKAKNITVQVQNAESHSLVLTTQTNALGEFQFTLPQQVVQQQLDLLVSADSGDGHRGEWLLEASEYLGPESTTADPSTALMNTVDTAAVREIVRQELKRELIPIKKDLAERQEKKVRLQDILGGIGCIIGLAGLLAWFQAKKKTSTGSYKT